MIFSRRVPSPMRLQRLLSTVRNAQPDPFKLLAPQLADVRKGLLSVIPSGHPALSEITNYYFLHPSKQVRPTLVLLFSQATNGLGGDWHKKLSESHLRDIDRPLTRPDVLNDWNPSLPTKSAMFNPTFTLLPAKPHRHSIQSSSSTSTTTIPEQRNLANTILPTQIRLAQIVEMLHTASLMHDDAIDGSALRRGAPSAPVAVGNKLSVLGGNFILGRLSTALSRLGDAEVTELIASVMSNLVDGEILQRKKVKLIDEAAEGMAQPSSATGRTLELQARTSREAWNVYLQKTYLKTASLMAKGARSAVVLGGCKEGENYKEIAYAYGRNLGIAFQLVDDVLDYEFASSTLGKPGGADLKLGLTTAPALYAWEEHPEMGELIQRKFDQPGDVELARKYVLRSSGVQRTRALARAYVDQAKEVLSSLPDSEAKACLEVLTERVIARKS